MALYDVDMLYYSYCASLITNKYSLGFCRLEGFAYDLL